MIFKLFIEFFKAGLFAIGGGPATIPFLKKMSENYGWFTNSELLDMIAVSESTPGALGTNMATYVGMKVGGVPGAIVATIALALPSLLIILMIINTITKYREEKMVVNAFYGIRPATAGLVLGAMFEIFVISLLDLNKINSPFQIFRIGPIMLFLAVFLIHKFRPKIHPIALIAMGAFAGIIFKL
ncbi:MAG: chromate transporter [Tissierellia bacterium]|nr:chromate transporter [Tissierellia bacterium]